MNVMNFEPMAARVVKEVELGFVEECEDPQLLTSLHFPSKVGGKPAWLDSVHLPRPEDIACGTCRKPMTFLLQVYAPIPVDENAPEGDEYHRTLFVFMCRDPDCHSVGVSKSFKALRCQLDKVADGTNCSGEGLCADVSNLSLNTTETKDNGSAPTISGLGSDHNSVTSEHDSRTTNSTSNDTQQVSSNSQTASPISSSYLCIVCGCSGPKRCGRCTQVHYCSKEHQTFDWKAGHKRFCEDLASSKLTLGDLNYSPSSGIVLPEYEIVTEVELDLTSCGNGEQERSEEERMADYYKFIKSGKCGKGEGELNAKALKDAATSEHKMDKQFRAFKKRVAFEPEQVRRGERIEGERKIERLKLFMINNFRSFVIREVANLCLCH